MFAGRNWLPLGASAALHSPEPAARLAAFETGDATPVRALDKCPVSPVARGREPTDAACPSPCPCPACKPGTVDLLTTADQLPARAADRSVPAANARCSHRDHAAQRKLQRQAHRHLLRHRRRRRGRANTDTRADRAANHRGLAWRPCLALEPQFPRCNPDQSGDVQSQRQRRAHYRAVAHPLSAAHVGHQRHPAHPDQRGRRLRQQVWSTQSGDNRLHQLLRQHQLESHRRGNQLHRRPVVTGGNCLQPGSAHRFTLDRRQPGVHRARLRDHRPRYRSRQLRLPQCRQRYGRRL